MDRDKIAHSMPSIRQRFEDLKRALEEGRMHEAETCLFGRCLAWGGTVRSLHRHGGRDDLAGHDALTRFFVTRHRGAGPGGLPPLSAGGLPPLSAGGLPLLSDAGLFLAAFSAFPYQDAIFAEASVGDHLGWDEDGNWLVSQILAGAIAPAPLRVDGGGQGWRFDLIGLYQTKAQALDAFIKDRYSGDFDAFLWAYVSEHDLDFDRDRAWLPAEGHGGTEDAYSRA